MKLPRVVQISSFVGSLVGDETACPIADFAQPLADTSGIPSGSTLIRTRFAPEFRIKHYYIGSETDPFISNWWMGIFGVVGVWLGQGAEEPVSGGDPMFGGFDPNFIILDKLVGDVEYAGPDESGQPSMVYAFRPEKTVLETNIKRLIKPENVFREFMTWNFQDPSDYINRSHLSFTQAFDLSMHFTCRQWWQLPESP